MKRSLLAMTIAGALALAGCESGGHFTLFGYTTKPNYDDCIHTVYVPICENKTFRRGLEFDLHRAIVKAIEQKTPYKVVSDKSRADTELTCTIAAFSKNTINRNQLNESREIETVLTVAVVWKDLRSGDILSQPRVGAARGPSFAGLPDIAPGAGGVPTQDNPAPPDGKAAPITPVKPAIVTATGNFIPEIGQSMTTAQQTDVNRLATQIVALMEKPW